MVKSRTSDLELAVVLNRKVHEQNCSELKDFYDILTNLCGNQDEHVVFESIKGVGFLSIKYPKVFPAVKVFKDIENLIPTLLSSKYPQLRSEAFKFLSITFEKSLSDEYIKLFDYFDEFLELHIDEVAMAYIMEILLGLFNYLPLKQYKRIMEQIGGIIEKGVERDLLGYSINFCKKGIELLKNPEHHKIAIENRLGHALVLRLSDTQLFDDCIYILKQIKDYEGMDQVFKDMFCFLPPFLNHHQESIRHLFSEIIAKQAHCGWEYLENLINRNFIPILVKYLTGTDMKIKTDMIVIASRFFFQQLQHQIIELLENNIVNILCRIIERDQGQTRLEAIKAMEMLLLCRNEIFKSFADSCRFSRLLTQVGIEDELNLICSRILTTFYPKAPLPVSNKKINPPVNNGINTGNLPLGSNLFNNTGNIGSVKNLAGTTSAAIPNNQTLNISVNNIQPSNQNLQQTTINAIQNNLRVPNNQKKLKTLKKKDKKTHVKATKPIKVVQKKIDFNAKAKDIQRIKTQSACTFPIARIHRKMKSSQYRVSKKAAVYLTGVLEYLCAEVLEVSGIWLRQDKRKIITPKDIQHAVRNDSELNIVMTRVVIPESGNCNPMEME